MSNDYEQGITEYTEAIRLDPNDARAYHNRGDANYKKGDYDNAIADFETALRIEPNDPFTKEWLERVRKTQGRQK